MTDDPGVCLNGRAVFCAMFLAGRMNNNGSATAGVSVVARACSGARPVAVAGRKAASWCAKGAVRKGAEGGTGRSGHLLRGAEMYHDGEESCAYPSVFLSARLLREPLRITPDATLQSPMDTPRKAVYMFLSAVVL